LVKPDVGRCIQANMIHQGTAEEMCLVERHDNNVGIQAKISTRENRGVLTDVHGIEPAPIFSTSNLRTDEEFKAWLGITQGFFRVLCDLIKLPNQNEKNCGKKSTDLSHQAQDKFFELQHSILILHKSP